MDQLSLCLGWIYEPPTEAALLPPAAVEPSDVDDYRVVLSLSSAWKLGVESIQQTQQTIRWLMIERLWNETTTSETRHWRGSQKKKQGN